MGKSQPSIKVKFKKLVEHAPTPKYATDGSIGMDLVAVDCFYDHDNKFHEYGTGLALELPEGYEGQIRPRSSISKTSLMLCNPPGTIDTDYRGEIMVRFKEIDDREIFYDSGDRIAQLVIVPVPKVELVEVEELSKTIRDAGGFGSSGK